MIPELLEVGMLLAFGAAWPTSIAKSYRSRTAKGKSVFFLIIIALGYACGLGSKFSNDAVNYVAAFYCINLIAVCVDIALYFRNRHLDMQATYASTAG